MSLLVLGIESSCDETGVALVRAEGVAVTVVGPEAPLVALEGVTGLLQPYVGQSFYAAMCVVLPVGNAMLRVISTEGLSK